MTALQCPIRRTSGRLVRDVVCEVCGVTSSSDGAGSNAHRPTSALRCDRADLPGGIGSLLPTGGRQAFTSAVGEHLLDHRHPEDGEPEALARLREPPLPSLISGPTGIHLRPPP